MQIRRSINRFSNYERYIHNGFYKRSIKVDDRKTRMSIDVEEKEHKTIKIRAAKEGISIRAFVTDCIREKIRSAQESNPKKK